MKTVLFTCTALIAVASIVEGAEPAGETGSVTTGSFYVSAKTGMNLLENMEIHPNYTDAQTQQKYTYKTGWLISGAAGWKQNFFRAEGEIEYATNNQDEYSVTDGVTSQSYGVSESWSALSVFANIYLDFDNSTRLTPFLFGGIGTTRFGYENINIQQPENILHVTDDSDLVFAWKLGAGFAWSLSDNLYLDLTYRYLKTNSTSNSTVGGYDYASHALSLGGRYKF